MVMDANGHSHKAAGRPDGGQYESKRGANADDDLDVDAISMRVAQMVPELSDEDRRKAVLAILNMDSPQPDTMVDSDGNRRPPTPPEPPTVAASLPEGDDNTRAYTVEETRSLLERAAHVEIGPHGVRLTDESGNSLMDEADGRHLDYKTARKDKNVRKAVRNVYRSTLEDMPAASRREAMRQAWRLSGPYDRRQAIDTSPNRRYIPAAAIARSLNLRQDKEKAARLLVSLHYEDAGAAGNVIRAGFPRDKHQAFIYLNNTWYQRYDKDVKDKDGNVTHRKGEPVRGDYVSARTGRKVTNGMLPSSKGATARAYLSMLYKPTNGVPDERTVKEIAGVFKACKDEPETQARMLWDLCYGNGSVDNMRGNVDVAKKMLGGRKRHERGLALLDRFSRGRGQGNVARMVAYQKPISEEAARIFLSMEPGDGRLANTGYTRRKRGKDGRMHDVTPPRLTEMRNFIHSVYEI